MVQTHGFKKAGIAECLFTLRKDGAARPNRDTALDRILHFRLLPC